MARALDAAPAPPVPLLQSTTLIRDVYHRGSHEFEGHHPLKRDMTRWPTAALGVPCEAVTVAGDNIHDLPMLAAAGPRLAVANAEPEVLAANDEGGLAHYVAQRWGCAGGGQQPFGEGPPTLGREPTRADDTQTIVQDASAFLGGWCALSLEVRPVRDGFLDRPGQGVGARRGERDQVVVAPGLPEAGQDCVDRRVRDLRHDQGHQVVAPHCCADLGRRVAVAAPPRERPSGVLHLLPIQVFALAADHQDAYRWLLLFA